VNVGSNGYANKLKYLFLCGSVVIHVHDGSPNHEFFESQLLPGMHYYAVSRVEEVADAVRHLRAHPAQARAIASAGTRRMEQLSFFEVTRYLAETFKEYGRRMTYQPEPGPNSFEVSGAKGDKCKHTRLACCVLLFEAQASTVRPGSQRSRVWAWQRASPCSWGGDILVVYTQFVRIVQCRLNAARRVPVARRDSHIGE
jgi:hypothetical protein